jgi:SAM-dependent methyltransferase
LKLLGKDQLLVTGPLDKARWNYSPLLALPERVRFRMIARLTGRHRYNSVLEIGYGSGVFLPELQRRADRLYGIDIHPHAKEVERVVAEAGVHATLMSASAEDMPIVSGSIDLIVAVSTLEYVDNKRKAAEEMRRVLRPSGRAAVVYPLPSSLSDMGLKLLTKEDPGQYGDGRRALLPALCEFFSVARRLGFPSWLPRPLQIYEAVLLAPKAEPWRN